MKEIELVKTRAAQIQAQADDLQVQTDALVVWDSDHLSTFVHADIEHSNRSLLDDYDARDWKDVKEQTSDPYAITSDDDVILANNAAGMDVNLPAATGTHKVYTIKALGAGGADLNVAGADTFEDGTTTKALAQYQCMRVVDSASGVWVIL